MIASTEAVALADVTSSQTSLLYSQQLRQRDSDVTDTRDIQDIGAVLRIWRKYKFLLVGRDDADRPLVLSTVSSN